MNHRPYPDVDRALHQLERGRVRRQLHLAVTADVSSFASAIQSAQAGVVFGFHRDLQDLDGELDNLYPHLPD